MSQTLTSHVAFKTVNADDDKIMDNIERYVMTRLYRHVFSVDQTDDEDQDLKVQVHVDICFLRGYIDVLKIVIFD